MTDYLFKTTQCSPDVYFKDLYLKIMQRPVTKEGRSCSLCMDSKHKSYDEFKVCSNCVTGVGALDVHERQALMMCLDPKRLKIMRKTFNCRRGNVGAKSP